MENQIKKIHSSNAFGVFVEIGCGLPVSNALLGVSGASSTVYLAECPYSKVYQASKYGEKIIDGKPARAVSLENIKHIINYYKVFEKPDNVNLIYVSSFQVGTNNDIATHGWIGISYKTDNGYINKYYHISIHDSLSRENYINKIKQIGVDLITSVINNTGIPSNCCIDDCSSLPELLTSLQDEDEDNFICIKDGKAVRLEDLFRGQDNIVLYKGSFNPIHSAHIHNAQLAKEQYDINPVFVISSSVYQKGWIDPTEILHRTEILNDLGYSVIITKDGFFNKNTEYLRKKFTQPIIYVVGSDTLNRILDSSYDILNTRDEVVLPVFGSHTTKTHTGMAPHLLKLEIIKFEADFVNTHFFVINRPGSELHENASRVSDYYTLVEEHENFHHISSTKIRILIEEKNFEAVKLLIPEKAYEKYINKK